MRGIKFPLLDYKQVWKFHGRIEHDEREAKESYTQTHSGKEGGELSITMMNGRKARKKQIKQLP